MSDSRTALQKVVAGDISQDEFIREYRKGNAQNEHPIGFRLKDQGLFEHECVQAYYKTLGEPAPESQRRIAKLVRRTTVLIDEAGEIHEAKPTNFANRPRWLYRFLQRSLTETHEHFVTYEDGVQKRLADAELDRLRPQPLGTAPFYDNDIKLTPTLLGIFKAIRRL